MMASPTKIRGFRWEDLDRFTHLFNEVNEIGNSEKACDPEFMGQLLSLPSLSPENDCYVAEHLGSLVGLVMVTPEPALARTVASGGVLPSYRNQGVGRRLLRKAVERGEALRAAVLHVQAPAEVVEARHLLESEEFRAVKTYWQMRWERAEVPDAPLGQDFSLRPFQLDQDEEALTALQNAAFGQHWGYCPNTVEEISARVRLKRCDPEGIVFVVDGARLAGYNWTIRASTEAGSTGWIAMTGVHPDYRGRGLGTAIVAAGMEYLAGKGVDGVELEVDSDNVPARELYLRLGFSRVNETVWFERRLDD